MQLGELINWLNEQNPELKVPHGFGEPMSYRGYYEDLAFTPKECVSFGETLNHAKGALGETFEGYKGGAFTMHELTDCWIAEYGYSNSDAIGPTILALWEESAA